MALREVKGYADWEAVTSEPAEICNLRPSAEARCFVFSEYSRPRGLKRLLASPDHKFELAADLPIPRVRCIRRAVPANKIRDEQDSPRASEGVSPGDYPADDYAR